MVPLFVIQVQVSRSKNFRLSAFWVSSALSGHGVYTRDSTPNSLSSGSGWGVGLCHWQQEARKSEGSPRNRRLSSSDSGCSPHQCRRTKSGPPSLGLPHAALQNDLSWIIMAFKVRVMNKREFLFHLLMVCTGDLARRRGIDGPIVGET